MIKTTKNQAGRFLIKYHGIHKTGKTKEDIMNYIDKVGCIQFDPVDVIGINQDLVLQSRIKDYNPQMLWDLLYKDRRLVDGLDKQMAIYNIRDWHLFKRKREQVSEWRKIKAGEYSDAVEAVRNTIREKGPLSSKDLKMDKKINWFWSKAHVGKAVLETLFFHGELIVERKERTIRYFDFTENLIPSDLLTAEDPNKTIEEYLDWHLHRRLNGIGLMWNKSSDAFGGILDFKAKNRNETFERLEKKGIIQRVEIEGINELFYITTENAELLESVKTVRSSCSFIAALDNIMWDRNLVEALFDFKYRWEIYTPKDKREYGYYVLPVIYKDKFIARIEAKRDKKSKRLIVENWWWQSGVRKTEAMKREIDKTLEAFAHFQEMEGVVKECDIM
ncbi:MAG TPA: winged helix DNA-binding domain-containing protein [Thermotogota bacterium]|nr:winged helix DNA-binding domain-containing protein [Thermotogota bacterium]